MAKIKLTYFNFDGGRAEHVRIALSLGGIEFEDHRVSFDEFGKLRNDLPLAALPVVEIDGVQYTQSNAMCRYFGSLAGLFPTDPWQAFLCDEVLEIVEDASLALGATFHLKGDEFKAARVTLVDGMFTRCLKLLDKRLAAAGGAYFADRRLTVADLKVYVWIKRLKSGGLDYVPLDLANNIAPALVDQMERVDALPGLEAYYAKRRTAS